MIDLNREQPAAPACSLHLHFNINDRGEILAKSDLGHIVLLVPCEEDRGDCVNVFAAASDMEPVSAAAAHAHQPRTMRDAMRTWRERLKLDAE